ncbi:DUF2971 domain-containing protein [Desulfobacula sp.]|uniref:DUF2971 domain-containing protein n=1 Tax=Desulfobacula sp. TaxID=2593537 RepID=UPI0025BD6141|nr:DUF2971 domain-containing protein [Desulfobacula sp.]MBC2704411.1 DUF2971 domain-containing protein [Desulfobacula sp.]
MEPIINCSNCKTEFFRRRLQCPSCGQVGISKLYKYVSYSERSLSILINKQIWCPKAKSLNDPFEFHFDLTQDSIGGIPIDRTSLENAKNDVKEMPVICFSEVNDDILMWSHYSQGHTGFCIEFERKEDNYLGMWDSCAPVIYNFDNQVLSFTPQQLENSESFTKIATSKSPHWGYEKEWRLIARREFADILVPLPAPISCIIFGCNMSINERKAIARILGPDMKYVKAKKKKKEFALSRIPIDFNDIINAF